VCIDCCRFTFSALPLSPTQVKEHLEKTTKFMMDVERKIDTLEGRVQEVLALQRIQQGEKQEILQALNGIRSDVSALARPNAPLPMAAAVSPSASANAAAVASTSPHAAASSGYNTYVYYTT
jgi:hypothetical protein